METISFPCFKPAATHHRQISGNHLRSKNRPNSATCFCAAADHDEDEQEHKRKQEILVKIAMLQTQKVRLTDFLDERSTYLTQFAQDADAEFVQIGEGALHELDQASQRIMENLDREMGRFEESSRMERREIEQGDRELDKFEEAIRRDRNQGLFFKSLGDRKPHGPRNRKSRRSEMEQRKLRRLTERAAGSSARKTVYVSLMTLLAATVTANSVIAFPHISWNKTLPLCLLFLALLGQYVYEARLSSSLKENETTTQLKQPENTQNKLK